MIPSYLELITAFKTSLATKRDEISAAKKRYEVGLEKLAFATESVNAMQVSLEIYSQQNFNNHFETITQPVPPLELLRHGTPLDRTYRFFSPLVG